MAVLETSRKILDCWVPHSYLLKQSPTNSSQLSKLHTWEPRPCQHWWTLTSGYGTYGCSKVYLYRSYSVLSATEIAVLSFDSPQSSPSVPTDHPAGEGTSPGIRNSDLLQFSSGMQITSCLLFSFSSFCFFCPTWLCRDLFLSF